MKKKVAQDINGIEGRFINCYYVEVKKSVTVGTIFEGEETKKKYSIPYSKMDELNRLLNEIKKLSVND